MTHKVRIGKEHFHRIDDLNTWCRSNIGPGGWYYGGHDFPDGYVWGLWWMLGSGEYAFSTKTQAEKFKEQLG